MESQLPHYELDACNHPELNTVSSLADMLKGIIKLGKNTLYPMVERLRRLVLTLPISTATTERVFSAMKLIKTRNRNKIGDDYLRSYTIIYVEKELATKISTRDIMEAFDLGGSRRSKFKFKLREM
jgi:hypothetical protein